MKVRYLLMGLLLLFCCSSHELCAQHTVSLFCEDAEIMRCATKAGLSSRVRSRAALDKRIGKWVRLCKQQGYLSFSVDSVRSDSSSYYIDFFAGDRYVASYISVDSTALRAVETAGLRRLVNDGRIAFDDYDMISSKIISYFENHGFPFAEVYLENVSVEQGKMTAELVVEPHDYIVMDSVVVKGSAKLRAAYLYPYLGIRKKKAYSEAVMRRVPAKIDAMPFASEIQPSGVEFVNDKASLYLFLDKKRTNSFDGYMAIVPVDDRTGKVGLAGEMNLALKNLFGVGESFDASWRAPGQKSQNVKLNVEFPYLFRTPLGVDFCFLLDKTDTSYLNMNYRLGIRYAAISNGYIKGYFDYHTSDVLVASLLQISEDDLNYVDYKKRMYGLSFAYSHLDYLFNPRKGVELNVEIAVGRRVILKNSSVNPSVYENVRLNSVNYLIRTDVEGYIPLHKRWVVKLGANAGTLFGTENVTNELFKLGGMNLLRGFAEDEIMADSYVVISSELRFLFAKIAYFNLFFNAAWYERNLPKSYVSDWPFGFGAGFTFDTKAGIFFLNYALGRQFNNPISLKNGKIHFGISVGF